MANASYLLSITNSEVLIDHEKGKSIQSDAAIGSPYAADCIRWHGRAPFGRKSPSWILPSRNPLHPQLPSTGMAWMERILGQLVALWLMVVLAILVALIYKQ